MAVVEKLNELARNDSDVDDDQEFQYTLKERNFQENRTNFNQRILPDLITNRTYLDQTSSDEVCFSFFLISLLIDMKKKII